MHSRRARVLVTSVSWWFILTTQNAWGVRSRGFVNVGNGKRNEETLFMQGHPRERSGGRRKKGGRPVTGRNVRSGSQVRRSLLGEKVRRNIGRIRVRRER